MPQRLRKRRSIRLPGWDYRTAASYFVTICTAQREHLFTDPRLYDVAANAWAYIPQQPHAVHVTLGEWVVMPNHVHGIVRIEEVDDAIVTPEVSPSGLLPGSLGAIVGNFKMLVTKRIRAIWKLTGTDVPVWQRGYWERIVRNEREYHAISRYIQDNPIRWAEDRENLESLLDRMRYVDAE